MIEAVADYYKVLRDLEKKFMGTGNSGVKLQQLKRLCPLSGADPFRTLTGADPFRTLIQPVFAGLNANCWGQVYTFDTKHETLPGTKKGAAFAAPFLNSFQTAESTG